MGSSGLRNSVAVPGVRDRGFMFKFKCKFKYPAAAGARGSRAGGYTST
jgi:hypothetical protein